MSEPKKAHGMAFMLCGENHVHMELLDENGDVFAVAVADLVDMGDQLVFMAHEYLDLVAESDDDGIGPVAGSC